LNLQVLTPAISYNPLQDQNHHFASGT